MKNFGIHALTMLIALALLVAAPLMVVRGEQRRLETARQLSDHGRNTLAALTDVETTRHMLLRIIPLYYTTVIKYTYEAGENTTLEGKADIESDHVVQYSPDEAHFRRGAPFPLVYLPEAPKENLPLSELPGSLHFHWLSTIGYCLSFFIVGAVLIAKVRYRLDRAPVTPGAGSQAHSPEWEPSAPAQPLPRRQHSPSAQLQQNAARPPAGGAKRTAFGRRGI